jgi:RNA-directed DNA polymerase
LNKDIEIKKDFGELSKILEIEPKKLSYILYVIPDKKKYVSFQVPKKTGGHRNIHSPVPELMSVQRNFKDYLLTIYNRKKCSHGFEQDYSILSNAKVHLKSKVVLNIDLKDFFESINFGRVYGLFCSQPFNFDQKASAAIAKLVTYENILPQGAPTSPILSNMIIRRMDNNFIQLAKKTKSIYTRYVDDITFSTTQANFDKKIINSGEFTEVVLSNEIQGIIEKNGFQIKKNKTRLLRNSVRKEVTGITINEFPNVRRKYINSIFGMIYSWKKYGYESAQKVYIDKYLKDTEKTKVTKTLYRSVIIGRIGYVAFVRGWDDVVVHKLCRKYYECDENPPKRIKAIGDIEMKFDVFIGHASEQKSSIAKPIYDELVKAGIKTFIDSVEIKWGDSLTRIINKALADSEYFLAIISIDSVKKSWPEREMNAAISRLISGKQKVLPLFVGTPAEIEECKNYYSLTSDILYKEWNNNAQEIADEIILMLSS